MPLPAFPSLSLAPSRYPPSVTSPVTWPVEGQPVTLGHLILPLRFKANETLVLCSVNICSHCIFRICIYFLYKPIFFFLLNKFYACRTENTNTSSYLNYTFCLFIVTLSFDPGFPASRSEADEKTASRC